MMNQFTNHQTGCDDCRESGEGETMREQFESEMKAKFGDLINFNLCANGDGEYFAWDAQVAFYAWQLGRKQVEP